MSQPSNVASRAEEVRRQTLEALHALGEKAGAFGLPAPPPGLETHRQKLQDNTYQVLVVGEAKRGKSTLINALIGRDILPTDVDVATSQVFRVCPADQESYRLRFEDGSQQAITAVDLPRYGSQVAADAEGVPRLDQMIRWIEADVPVRFLPANVRVLDTPGLGALYAAHAQITHRFVPHADAVLFVLDSQAPIGEPEVRFVDTLLGVTRSILFVQTKIDLFRREAWQEIQARNQDILRQRFQGRLADGRVWPVSSTNLRKAAQTGDADYLLVSRHRELAAALQAFLVRVSGWGRSAEAVLLAGHYHTQSRQVLARRLDDLVEESRQKRAASQQRATEQRKQFESDWGERGQKRRELLEGIQRAATLAKQGFRQRLQPGGSIEADQRERIDALQSVEDARRYGEALGERVASEASTGWREACLHFRAHCTELLGPFLASTAAVVARGNDDEGGLALQPGRPLEMADDWWTKVKGARMEFLQTVGMVSIAGSLLGFVITTSWFPPLAIGGAVAAGVWGLVRGWQAANINQIKAARQELHRHLATMLQEVRKHFFDVDAATGRFSRVDEYFNGMERSLSEHVASLARQKLEEAQSEIERLMEESRLDDQQRKGRAEAVRQQLAEWDSVGHRLTAIRSTLQELDRGLAPVPTASA
jgi:tRNA U34 5-carboxymethylaminomethyl modifying GTPase MnmE/TrmE